MLTFLLCVFIRVQFPFALLTLQLLLVTSKSPCNNRKRLAEDQLQSGSDSPSPEAESPPFLSSGQEDPFPASSETDNKKKLRNRNQTLSYGSYFNRNSISYRLCEVQFVQFQDRL